jgi:hypothetical protein
MNRSERHKKKTLMRARQITTRHPVETRAMARVLQDIRRERGLTIREMAAEWDIPHAVLGNIELGFGCSLDTLLTIHKRTGISLNRLLGIRKRASARA